MAKLGPDPLRADADPDRAWERIRRSRLPIGRLLMDQSVLAGVGNVYRAELLFRHRMHPLRPGRTLRSGQWRAMWDDLVELMEEGVRTGRIDTVRPEHTPEAMGRAARVDDHGGEVYVYRRTGLPCLRVRPAGPDRGAGHQKPVLVLAMSTHVPLPSRRLTRFSDSAEGLPHDPAHPGVRRARGVSRAAQAEHDDAARA